MKKTLLTILTIITSFIFINKLNALQGYITGEYVIVRSEPNTSSAILGQIDAKYTTIDLVDDTLHNQKDPACDIGWYKINFNGTTGYMCGKYVSIGVPGDKNPSYNTDTYEARVYGYSVYVQSLPNSSSSYRRETLLTGTNLIIEGNKVAGPGCSDGWYFVKYHKNSSGYICSTYVRKREELIASNAAYEQELKNAGWPDTYIPYLVKLHEQHPNWKFNPIKTNVDWSTLVSMESNKNVLHKNFVSDAVREVYSNGPYKEAGYLYATDGVNAFMLDPRNFLSEKLVFMFEALGYNYGTDDKISYNKDAASAKNYYTSISSMLGSSFLNTDEYKNMFIHAGFKFKVSPIHLVGRVIQEGTSNESYPGVSGNSNYTYGIHNLNGYYNFYNIDAYKDNTTDLPVARGLASACGSKCGFSDNYGKPWDTREKAIFGGAQFISGSYISVGQNTLYFQKFDVEQFWHQYQTNVTAQISEGIDAFLAYQKANLINGPIEFDIPIYNNMPSVVSLPTVASTINSLKEIKIDGKSITGFDPDIVDYIVYVQDTKTSVTIEGIKMDNKSTVTGTGSVLLTGETTSHQITVTAENGFKKTYHLEIKKAKDATTIEDILNNLSVAVNGDLMSKISPGTHVGAIEQSVAKTSVNATVTVYTSTGNIVSSSSPLMTGYKIKLTSPNGETRQYRIVVNGDTNGDGEVTILDLLKIQKHILNSSILTGEYKEGADVNHDGNITLLDLLLVKKYILKEISL